MQLLVLVVTLVNYMPGIVKISYLSQPRYYGHYLQHLTPFASFLVRQLAFPSKLVFWRGEQLSVALQWAAQAGWQAWKPETFRKLWPHERGIG